MDSNLLKTKSIEKLVGDAEHGGKALRRTLTAMDLTLLGIGAIIGVFFGLMLAFAIQQFADWPVAWSLSAIILSVSICLITGIVFGWYPARQAASLDPIKALHAE